MNISGHPYENILAPPLLSDTERSINNPFIILFEKTTVKYTDTQSSSLLPVKIKVRFFNSKKLTEITTYNVAYF